VAGNVGSGTVREMQEWVEYMTFAGDSAMANLRRLNGREQPWRVKYFGVGNENWGCGGNMTAEHYADLYRRYQTYVRSYPGNRIYKVACGPSDWDVGWMETVLSRAARQMDAISLHYYVFTGSWGDKGDAAAERVDLQSVRARRSAYPVAERFGLANGGRPSDDHPVPSRPGRRDRDRVCFGGAEADGGIRAGSDGAGHERAQYL